MYNGGRILVGVCIFLVLVTFPFWNAIGRSTAAPELDLDTPVIQQLSEKKCVEPAAVMRENHMQLLDDWRNQVVREGNRVYTAADGTEYQMSLQNTCLSCHSNKADFCDQCHDYAGITPDCWTCHLEPEGN
ncbi:MAG: sulfate reduction electron transfer complex DsrMKJOP subunit DsrJ [Bacillota bacterium]